ncbi:protein of unknown function [Methylorubrum extorquens]|uniref:Uncharacterized protein n=1 Tax=Methylorubrum extorquens TaxID=408 RepID=A0A2N9AX71_METEX|nr:protein of unknown function [Methylorubrum extorquens]
MRGGGGLLPAHDHTHLAVAVVARMMTAVMVGPVRAHPGAVGAPAGIDAEHAVHATHRTADGAAHDAADRTGDAIALGRAAAHSTGNALGLSLTGDRHEAEHQPCGSNGETSHGGDSSLGMDTYRCFTRPVATGCQPTKPSPCRFQPTASPSPGTVSQGW